MSAAQGSQWIWLAPRDVTLRHRDLKNIFMLDRIFAFETWTPFHHMVLHVFLMF